MVNKSLIDNIKSDLFEAMKAKERDTVDALRYLLAELQNQKIELQRDLTESEVMETIAKQIKRMQDSIELFLQGGRQDLADKEIFNSSIIKKYLPTQATIEEVEEFVTDLIAGISANISHMSEVISKAKDHFGIRSNGKDISSVVSKLLKK